MRIHAVIYLLGCLCLSSCFELTRETLDAMEPETVIVRENGKTHQRVERTNFRYALLLPLAIPMDIVIGTLFCWAEINDL